MVDLLRVLAMVTFLAFGVAFTVLYLRGMARGPRGRGQVPDKWLAVARCPKCSKEYESEWTPGISFSSVRMGLDRYQRCPACKDLTWGHFERWAPASPSTPAR
ncbi:MAG: hypothetical protein L3K19_08745 [Thermoplasmata archaeon]|nr:hypothetical protein [Thermoplasmata archaeon]